MSVDQVERKLAAIFAADVEGYSHLMGIDEVATLRTLAAHRVVMDGLTARHHSRKVSTAGDSVLAGAGTPHDDCKRLLFGEAT